MQPIFNGFRSLFCAFVVPNVLQRLQDIKNDDICNVTIYYEKYSHLFLRLRHSVSDSELCSVMQQDNFFFLIGNLIIGKFDHSTEEIASISCYQKSIDDLKKNNADEDLYFLNVIIQVAEICTRLCTLPYTFFFLIHCKLVQLLWNLRHFRNEFLRGRSTFDIVHEDLCIAEKLYRIFSAWEKNEHSKTVLLLTDVKTTLCGIVNDSNMFQTVRV